MRIVLAGGGTGGHITPILTCAHALHQLDKNLELIYIGSKGGVGSDLVAAAGLKAYSIAAGKLRRYSGQSAAAAIFDVKAHAANFADSFKVIAGYGQSLKLLRQLRPDVVFVKGGYVGLPVGLAAKTLNIPLIIHESDIVPGLTNRLLARSAQAIAVSWPVRYFEIWRGYPLLFTGNPIREELLDAKLAAAKNFFKWQQSRPTLLVMGGSGGASALNEAVVANLSLLTKQFNIIHISGQRDFKAIKARTHTLAAGEKAAYRLYPFLGPELGLAYRGADIVLSRAGMNSLAEIAAFGLPAVVVPYPHATGDHQQKNAEILEANQAAIVLPQAQLTARLVDTLTTLAGSPDHQQLLKKGLAKIAKPNAAMALAKAILKLV